MNIHDLYRSEEKGWDSGSTTGDSRAISDLCHKLFTAEVATIDIITELKEGYPKVWSRLMHCPPGTKGMPLLHSKTIKWIRKCESAKDEFRRKRKRDKQLEEAKRRAMNLAKTLLKPEERQVLGLDF
jgi:hypothetical protein